MVFALGVMLTPCGCHQYFELHLSNQTTNEELRSRWNANKQNSEFVKIYRDQSTCMQKVRYMCCSRLPESRLHKLCKLVELYEQKYNDPIEGTETSLGLSPQTYET